MISLHLQSVPLTLGMWVSTRVSASPFSISEPDLEKLSASAVLAAGQVNSSAQQTLILLLCDGLRLPHALFFVPCLRSIDFNPFLPKDKCQTTWSTQEPHPWAHRIKVFSDQFSLPSWWYYKYSGWNAWIPYIDELHLKTCLTLVITSRSDNSTLQCGW